VSILFRALPSVDKVLDALFVEEEFASIPRTIVREHVNSFLDVCREEIRAEVIQQPEQLAFEILIPRMKAYIRAQSRPHFRRVLNGTGVVVHTNLGRSLLASSAVDAVVDACAHYSNLEFDLNTGDRGSRYSHVEELLCTVCGAEAGLVVNNNAAAVLIVLDTLCKGKEVPVSRGQLVEIGGSFRIPEVMEKSGATLREVGATNRTHLTDYEQVISENTGALLRVHTSNYRIVGFHKEVSLEEMVALGNKHDLPVIEDLGSGSFTDFSSLRIGEEPTVQQVVGSGADVVTFSGDKVLGGPQAGIIVGKKKYIDMIKRNPMNRAMRIDKMTLAALEATLRLYREPELARKEIPTLSMMFAEQSKLKQRARRLANRIKKSCAEQVEVSVIDGNSSVGGGSFPERDLPTALVAVKPKAVSETVLKKTLLDTEPLLVGRIEHQAFCLDPRTLTDKEFPLVIAALQQALSAASL